VESSEERRTDHRCRALLATTTEACLILDADGIVQVMNEAAESIFDRSRSDVVGQTVDVLGDPDLAEKTARALSDGLDGPACFWVTDLERKLSCRMAPYEQDDRLLYVLSVRDESELFREQERTAAILASTGDGLLVFSLDDTVTFVNPPAAALLERPAESLLGARTSIDALLGVEPDSLLEPVLCWESRDCHRTDCPAYGQTDHRCWLLSGTLSLDGHPSTFKEKQTVCANCTVFQTNRDRVSESGMPRRRELPLGEEAEHVVRVTTNPVIDHAGRYVGTVTTLADITMEREVNQMKTEFVSTVSHELRTPLTSIKGYIDLVLEGEAGDLSDLQEEFLGIVKQNSDRLVTLINDLLDISRIESGRVHLKIEPVDLGDVVADAAGTFRAVLDKGEIALEIDVAEGIPRVAADRSRLGQVVTNLISNAIKYSPGGGTVRVEARVEVGEVVLSVHDEGIGIGDEDQKGLFAKFYRVDSSYTREIGGTGLGLAICKSIIELHGGRIWVDSVLGEGSTFAFSVPVAPTGLVRMPEVEGPAEVGGTVLVVDGEESIANLIETYLVRRGYDVVKAASGREAIEMARLCMWARISSGILPMERSTIFSNCFRVHFMAVSGPPAGVFFLPENG
jgi:signal transduction histidine kinase